MGGARRVLPERSGASLRAPLREDVTAPQPRNGRGDRRHVLSRRGEPAHIDPQFRDNTMGRTPAGSPMPNGVDFWWDEFPSNKGNCFGPNVGSDGQTDHTTTDPPESPTGEPAPGYAAKRNCDSPLNVGTGDSQKEAVLVACAQQLEGDANDQASCDWFVPPPKPGGGGTGAGEGSGTPLPVPTTIPVATTATFPELPDRCILLGRSGGTLTCDLFVRRLG